MGALFSKFRRKRRLETDDDDDNDYYNPATKRVKLNSTSGCSTQIGYGILFQQGRDSDIEVVLLDKTWKLHKSFLQQSPYFMKLLGEKSKVNKLRCSVSDPNIDCKSLELCFGFLYGGPLNFIEENNVENVLATATFLGMADIVERSAIFLTKNSNIENAVKYYYMAEKYGLEDVCHHNYQRLLLNLMPHFKSLLETNPAQCNVFLSELKMNLLLKLLKDSDLVIVRDEFDLYLLMKKWTALVLAGKPDVMTEEAENKLFLTDNGQCFLETARGKTFSPLFEVLHLPSLFTGARYFDILKGDKILPLSWLQNGLDASWKTHVTYYDASEPAPDVNRNITPIQRVRIIRREKTFVGPSQGDQKSRGSPFRLFKRFTVPLARPDVAMTTLNGFVFTLCITPDNTLELSVRVKPDVPPILIPTLLYLRYRIFDINCIWNEGSLTAPPSLSPASDTDSIPATEGGASSPYDLQWRSYVFNGSDLMFLLPYPPSGLSRVLYDLPSGYYERIRTRPKQDRKSSGNSDDVPPLHAFLTIKMVPYSELKAEKLL